MIDERYHLAARLMHWIMAAGFVFMWGCGYAMTTLVEDDSSLEELLFDLHISVGVTLLALLAARIAILMVPYGITAWCGARFFHVTPGALYRKIVLTLVMALGVATLVS